MKENDAIIPSEEILTEETPNLSVLSIRTGAKLQVLDANAEPAEDIVKIPAGQDLLFEVGAWFDSLGHEVDVSEAKVYVNDESVDVDIQEDGTFIIDGREAGEDFKVCVKALTSSQEELMTNEIYIVIE